MAHGDNLFGKVRKRYGNVEPEALEAILCPILIPIVELDKKVVKLAGQSHWRATFVIDISEQSAHLMQRGMTGKFIPADYLGVGVWKEICKGRLIEIDWVNHRAVGEVYVGSNKADLLIALEELETGDLLEIDQFGASAKILSSLSEYYLLKQATELGYRVRRMPEDTAKHLGTYYNYDFEFERNGVTRKVEVKSLWGTDTDYARLIHSTTTPPKKQEEQWTLEEKGNYYPTSSCKFMTQDIFAVNLFLRTGNCRDFAFARSVSILNQPYGLPVATEYPAHVNQNPLCQIGNGSWFASIQEVWDLA